MCLPLSLLPDAHDTDVLNHLAHTAGRLYSARVQQASEHQECYKLSSTVYVHDNNLRVDSAEL